MTVSSIERARLEFALLARLLVSMSEKREKAAPEIDEEAFDRFMRRRDELLRLVTTTEYALNAMNGIGRLAETLRSPSAEVEFARQIEAQALAEADAGSPMLHSAATVLIWGAIETAVRDYVVGWLLQFPDSRRAATLKKVRVSVAEYESVDGEDRMRYLVGALERELGASLKPGVGRLECILEPFGIRPIVEEADRRTLHELAAVRNVIVHRNGVADSRLLALCPWLDVKLGETIRIDHRAFRRYVQAVSNFAAEVVEAGRRVLQGADITTHTES